jgi:phosphatidate cytidylyltransferase
VTALQEATLVLIAVAAVGLGGAVIYAVVARVLPATRAKTATPPRTVLARGASYTGLALVLALAANTGVAGIAVLCGVLGAIGLAEWSHLFDLPLHHRVGLLVADVAIVAVVATQGSVGAPVLVGGLVLVGALWPVIRADTGRATRDLGLAAVGCALLPVLLAHDVALRVERGEVGAAAFVALAVACACSDVGAFLVGRRFGHALLAPNLSPHKTRAGVVGNLAGAALGIALFLPGLAPALGVGPALVLVPLVAGGAVWGDLLESAVKREAGVTDAGAWLPGFGGILDRIDSLLITGALAYWFLRIAVPTS